MLRPLVDLLDTPASSEFRHPRSKRSILDILSSLTANTAPTLFPVIPFPLPAKPISLHPYRPLIMGILNVTPDSFSDGSESKVSSLDTVITLAKQLILDGADILDIGGMSTRPGVSDSSVSIDEELSRVIPVIQALRLEEIHVPISVDTFRPAVAEAAIHAGASCINDVRGGREEGMLEVMKRMDVPVVLMHSRGDSISMLSEEAKDYSMYADAGGGRDGAVLRGVQVELMSQVDLARKEGVKDWNIILDPGVGFAKNQPDTLRLINNVDTLFTSSSTATSSTLTPTPTQPHAVLVGTSRKGFIGSIISQPIASLREFGNAAITTTLAGQKSVNVIRVHDVKAARDVVNMTAALKEV